MIGERRGSGENEKLSAAARGLVIVLQANQSTEMECEWV
jgi:hypothetical protein